MKSSRSVNVVEVDDRSFDAEVLRADRPVLVDFGAKWCGPCKALAPIVERLADENAGTLKVVTVDIDASPEISARYGVRGAPTVMVFKHGQKTAQHLGLTTRDKLLSLVAG